ncbi:hypothetical protein [uncultured Corynebacterium sp.]|uniref:hypothetical protein n=1 Tax=uncultured Corynebacterium sp. TaxID=159447 RepID=UPI0025D1A743|nr:hypothetical protein [uncultured Corynebacterium sp.]
MANGDVTWGDNVIYADFGARAAAPGAKAKKGRPERRKAGGKVVRPSTDVARRLYDAVADAADEQRRARGEAYFREGHVLGFRMVDGQIVGEVKGSQIEPFTVLLKLPFRDGADQGVDGLLRWMAETNGAADDLEKGWLPEVRLSALLLAEDESVTCRCSCPDPILVCKHAVAVAAAAAQALDAEPMRALELRGTGVHEARHTLARLIAEAAGRATARHGRGGADGDGDGDGDGAGADGHGRRPVRRPTGPLTGDPVLELVEEDFWGTDLPALEVPAPEPMEVLRDTDPTLLHAALRTTTVLSVETLRAVSDLEDCWDHLLSPPSFGDVDLDDGIDRRRGRDDDGVVAASFDDDDED